MSSYPHDAIKIIKSISPQVMAALRATSTEVQIIKQEGMAIGRHLGIHPEGTGLNPCSRHDCLRRLVRLLSCWDGLIIRTLAFSLPDLDGLGCDFGVSFGCSSVDRCFCFSKILISCSS